MTDATIGYPEIEKARATRLETLELVEGLDQERVDAVAEGQTWSVGHVLDHLLKVEGVYWKNIARVVERKKSGETPFVYTGIDSVMPLPKLVRRVAPLFEIPFAVPNSLLPGSLRRRLSANRALSVKAPKAFEPEPGRPIEDLRSELRAMVDRADALEAEPFDLYKLYYYNPVLGLATLPGALDFLAVHEERHQRQMRDLLTATHAA